MKACFARKIPDIKELCALCEGRIAGNWDDRSLTTPVEFVCTDSRDASVGGAFAAIRGAKVDGHKFISRAAACGAVCAIAEEVPADAADFPIIIVDDTVKALGRLGSNYSRDLHTVTVGVTGSVGKSTTKEFIASVLSVKYKVFRTEGNFNSVIGMPLSMLTIPEDTEYAVIEMGMGEAGDVGFMSRLAKPQIAVITNIGTSHLESLGSRENIARAKLEIAEGLAENGTLLLCGGEPLLAGVGKTDGRVAYFSADDKNSDYRASGIRTDSAGTVFDAYCRGKVIPDLEISVQGKHNVSDAMAAVAVGTILGLDGDSIRRGLNLYRPMRMRQQMLDVEGVTLMVDCYNASPESMRAACDVMSVNVAAEGRRIAVLGDMLELGEDSAGFHRLTGEYFARAGVEYLFTFGERAEKIADGYSAVTENGKCARYTDISDEGAERLAEDIVKILRRGDVVLLKASRLIRAERLAELMSRMLREGR